MPAILGVHETILYANDLAAAEAFYGGALGLRALPRSGDRGVVLDLGNDAVLIVFDAAKTALAHPEVPSHGANGPGHVALRIDDLDGWRARLQALGVAIEREVSWPRGGRSIYVRDPAGNSVELVAGAVWDLGATHAHAAQVWDAVDRAFESWLGPPDRALDAASEAAARAGLPEIAVAPAQGRLLEVLARAIGARRVLEVGTLAGYSTLWLARALPPGGELVTLELEPDRARLARENIARAGCAAQVTVVDGPATDSMDALIARATAPFDLVFIDADKERCVPYLDRAVALSRPGTLIVVDNVVRRGRVVDAGTGDASVDGVRAMMERIREHPRLAAAGVQTVGSKGYDGMLLAVVGADGARPSA